MRRKPSAAEDRLDPRELIARLSAEHGSPAGRPGRSAHGRHAAGATATIPAPRSADGPGPDPGPGEFPREPALLTHTSSLPAVGLDPEGAGPPPISPMTGMPVITAADVIAGPVLGPAGGPDDGGPDDSAPDDSGPDGPGSGCSGDATDIEREAPEPRRGRRRAPRSALRRWAPLTVGLAAVLVAAAVAWLLRPVSDQGPDLAASLTSADTAQGPPDAPSTGVAAVPAPGALSQAVDSARRHATTTTRPPVAANPANPATGTARSRGPVAAGDGSTAAGRLGWTPIGGDEFSGGLDKWGLYDGAGHGGNGRRTPDAVSTAGGILTIRGDSNGNTGGMAFNDSRRYGRYEMRAKFPAGDSQYHPVLLLWPSDVEWPRGGEIDFAETDSASNGVSFFLHYGADNNQKSANRKVDITQWHNYAVEWTPNGITGYLDGQQWFSSTDPGTLPPSKMHPTIQLDYFPDGGSPRPTEMQVDWLRIYS
ncbi:family 16 glycosylhydrolase [Pseudonocardia kujensis]|uniref:glycoside hydrolase family 16 protein n=1 Tax=Pseudonocardia kujensis TaxID=1128675 RepID=UPI001E29C725|nr:glycoside hydrolase family 16 protein [Pseudonocardia kujensis]MCE0761740.1 family 16 glycosylhydrolase [Pseudonocardia kujensis]